MSEETVRYEKLPGAGASVFARVRLWLGPDHLLYVAATPIGERYKRFYFADIQSFTVRHTAKWIWLAIVWLVFAALSVLPALAVDDSEGVRWTFGIIAGVFLVAMIAHLALGPTCSVMIRTAVQAERLPSLGRVRNARRVLDKLRPLIEAAQSSSSTSATTTAL